MAAGDPIVRISDNDPQLMERLALERDATAERVAQYEARVAELEEEQRRLQREVEALASDPGFEQMLAQKRTTREQDEAEKPLAEYRREELERMNLNFYGFDPSYHVARYNFVYKVLRSHTPLTIASHRRVPSPEVRKAS